MVGRCPLHIHLIEITSEGELEECWVDVPCTSLIEITS